MGGFGLQLVVRIKYPEFGVYDKIMHTSVAMCSCYGQFSVIFYAGECDHPRGVLTSPACHVLTCALAMCSRAYSQLVLPHNHKLEGHIDLE